MDLADWQAWWKHFGSFELQHLLLLWWDPVGVYGVREARDEYNGYSGRLARMLREGASSEAIASFLGDAEEGMGFSRAPERDAAVAARVVAWYERAIAAAARETRTDP